jgi:hypothetical protein
VPLILGATNKPGKARTIRYSKKEGRVSSCFFFFVLFLGDGGGFF